MCSRITFSRKGLTIAISRLDIQHCFDSGGLSDAKILTYRVHGQRLEHIMLCNQILSLRT